MEFQNKVVLITGASRGVGLHLANALLNQKADVIAVYNSNVVPLVYADQFKCDLKNETEIKSLFRYIKKEYGKLDYVINCAAIDKSNDITEKTKEEFMEVLEVNLVGTFLICKYALNMMDTGAIVNISSTDAQNTYSPLSMDYAASKAGVENLTKNLSLRYPKIKICALAPNWIATETVLGMSPHYLESELRRVNQKRLLTKEEVTKKIIEILTSNQIKSGEIIRMDGEYE